MDEAVKHTPNIDKDKVIEYYSLKDNVDIKYVCTTELEPYGHIYDVFYRADGSPHPEFGNRYFGITTHGSTVYIGNADKVEELEFSTYNNVYSQGTHDFRSTGDGCSIDGGRAYLRLVGDFQIDKVKEYKVKDGEFVDG